MPHFVLRPSALFRRGWLIFCLACTSVTAVFTPRVDAGLTLDVSFDDPGDTYAAFYAQLHDVAEAAAADWGQYFTTPGTVTLGLEIQITASIPRATGRSDSSTYVTTIGGVNVFEQSAATQVRTGTDVNGAAPDVLIQIAPNYMSNELWFDPNPTARVAPVPIDRTDAVSVFLHEFGHAFGFNGWKSGTDGTSPDDGFGPYESTFDQYETFDGANLWFNGPYAMSVYGGPMAVTYDNNAHFGNALPRPGSDLIPDLMNGVVYYRGTRYAISPLDLAVMKDVGLPVQTPGDVTYDGLVNGQDLAAVASHWLQSGPHVDGDANSDGLVNGQDLAVIASHWLQYFGGGQGGATAVPEPSTIVLAALGAVALLACRRNAA